MLRPFGQGDCRGLLSLQPVRSSLLRRCPVAWLWGAATEWWSFFRTLLSVLVGSPSRCCLRLARSWRWCPCHPVGLLRCLSPETSRTTPTKHSVGGARCRCPCLPRSRRCWQWEAKCWSGRWLVNCYWRIPMRLLRQTHPLYEGRWVPCCGSRGTLSLERRLGGCMSLAVPPRGAPGFSSPPRSPVWPPIPRACLWGRLPAT
mmetsp:Transcript_119075/g.273067  ORF Transcript_119075/g.273067 Transcript_119075/m.273067 type:complete len:202 (+) Transcript_119075:525-1130(+)